MVLADDRDEAAALLRRQCAAFEKLLRHADKKVRFPLFERV